MQRPDRTIVTTVDAVYNIFVCFFREMGSRETWLVGSVETYTIYVNERVHIYIDSLDSICSWNKGDYSMNTTLGYKPYQVHFINHYIIN